MKRILAACLMLWPVCAWAQPNTAPTAPPNTCSTQIANTQFMCNAMGGQFGGGGGINEVPYYTGPFTFTATVDGVPGTVLSKDANGKPYWAPGGGPAFPEAPPDGQMYGRINGSTLPTINMAWGPAVNKAGDTMTGALTIGTGGLTVTAGGLTVTSGGVTITAGGLTISANGASIVGNTAVTGTLTSSSTLAVASPIGSGVYTTPAVVNVQPRDGVTSGNPLASAGAPANVNGYRNGIQRWNMQLGNGAAECPVVSGPCPVNSGGNFALNYYDDAGTQHQGLVGTRAGTFNIQFPITTFTQPQSAGAGPVFQLWKFDGTPNGQAVGITGVTQTTTSPAHTGGARWQILLANAVSESGSNAGSDFELHRYADGSGNADIDPAGSPMMRITRQFGIVFYAGNTAALATPGQISGLEMSVAPNPTCNTGGTNGYCLQISPGGATSSTTLGGAVATDVSIVHPTGGGAGAKVTWVKNVSQAWSAGTGTSNGCLDTGTAAAGWYHVWLIWGFSATTGGQVTDILCSLSATNPTWPAGFIRGRRIGSYLLAGAPNGIYPFAQINDEFTWITPFADASNAPLSVGSGLLLGVTTPSNVITIWSGTILLASNGTDSYLTLGPGHVSVQSNNPPGNISLRSGSASPGGTQQEGDFRYRTNLVSQIGAGLGGASTTAGLYIITKGYWDYRGK